MKTVFNVDDNSLELISDQYKLLGLINSFNNILQSKADAFFDDISWKQIYLLTSISLFEENPTIRDIANLTGTTHQNAAQILSKLKEKDYISFKTDDVDQRKRRVFLTEKGTQFCMIQEPSVDMKMKQLFSRINPEELHITLNVVRTLCKSVNEL